MNIRTAAHIVLAGWLGSFLAQVSEERWKKFLRYTGHMAESKTDSIRNAAFRS
jgi:hypothetical protein